MSKKKILYLFLIFVVSAIIWKLQNNLKKMSVNSPKNKAQASTDVQPVISLGAAKNEVPIAAEKADVKKTAINLKNSGLCSYFKKDGVPLLARKSYLHLVNKKSKYILLPKNQIGCLDNSTYEFHIVDYHPQYDVAFNYYANIQIRLSEKIEFTSDDSKSQLNQIDFKKYGFENQDQLVKFLMRQGYDLNSGLVSFAVQINSSLIWSKSSSNPGFYPGLFIITSSEFKSVMSDSQNVLIATYNFSKDKNFEFAKQFKFLNLNTTSNFNIDPDHVVPSMSQRLFPITKDKKNIYVYEEFGGDTLTNFIATYVSATSKDQKVFVIEDNFFSKSGYKKQVPQNINGMIPIDESELFKANNNFIVIDTRSLGLADKSIKGSYAAPVYFRAASDSVLKDLAGYSLTSKFVTNEINGQIVIIRNKYADIISKAVASGKKIVLHGSDDADYAPILFFEAVKSTNVNTVYWLRSGFRQFEQKIKMQAIDQKNLKNAVKITRSEKQNLNFKYDSNSAKKVIFIERKSNKKKKSLKNLKIK